MSTRSLVYWVALVGGLEIGLRGYLADDGRLFHAGAWTVALVLAWSAWRARGIAARAALAGAAVGPAALSLLAWAGVPAESENPLAGFWETHGLEQRVLGTIVEGGPVRLFGQEIPLDPRGLRLDPDPPGAPPIFHIVALGGSTTFGATRTPEEQPWPEWLERRIETLSCTTPVEVTNAGRVGRALAGSVQALEPEVERLDPDLVVYYPSPQDLLGLLGQVPDGVTPRGPLPERASSLLRRLERGWRWRGVERHFRAALAAEPEPLDLEAVAQSPSYRRFLLGMRRRGVEVALATVSLAVNGDSTEERIRRYEQLEPRTRRIVLASRFLTRLERGLAASYRATLVDTRPDLDGGDDALYLDLFHLTEAGRQRLADRVLEGLLPLLTREVPGCTAPAGG